MESVRNDHQRNVIQSPDDDRQQVPTGDNAPVLDEGRKNAPKPESQVKRPLKAVARVRIPSGLLHEAPHLDRGAALSFVGKAEA